MAVAWHAVRRSEITKKDVAIVIGCGPIGLAVILMLKAIGVRTVIASNHSPFRRTLAAACGADVVVNPAEDSPYAAASGHGHLETLPEGLGLALSTVEKLHKLRLPWWHVWRAAEKVGAATPKRPIVFECVGVPGIIEGIITGAPMSAASSSSVFVWAPTASGRPWRSTKRSTCASCSVIPRWNSATRSTCSPMARSTSPR